MTRYQIRPNGPANTASIASKRSQPAKASAARRPPPALERSAARFGDDLAQKSPHFAVVAANQPVQAKIQRHWRDKPGHEVDFVLAWRCDKVDAIECQWNPAAFDGSALRIFRGYYPQGRNYLVTPSGDPAYNKHYGDLDVRICTPAEQPMEYHVASPSG